MKIDCPRCGKPLEVIGVGGVQVDVCRSCEGVWFDKDELLRAFTAARGGLEGTAAAASWEGQKRGGEEAGRHELSCPRCRARLDRYRYGSTTDIVVDGCEKGCGLWLDDGEIKHVFEYLAQSQKALTSEERAKLKGQLQAIESEHARKEALIIENLTKLDDRPGPVGAIGKLVQFVYGTFYKSGFR